jgi:PAS domain S-box-containing protein
MEETYRAKILNVDDDEVGRYSVTRILKQAGFDITEAATGADALKLAMKLPDLVLLDVNLPDIHGFEVCRRLKSDPATRAIPVLHLSATYLDSKDKVNGLEGGADGYLTQPVEPPVLLAHIRALLRSSKLEKQLARANRSLKAVLYCNEALLRAQSKFDLVQEACRILVLVAGYRFVWVGSREMDTEKTIRPIARWGEDEGLSDLAKASWDETTAGCCPMGEAIRTGKPFLISDIRTDSRCEPWRTEALKRGFVSALALPLLIGRDEWGAISILSDTTGTFDDEEIKLLSELARDLSYGLESLRIREEARHAREALLESEQLFRLAFENANIGVCLVDTQGRLIRVNSQMCEMIGYSQSELEGMTVRDITHPEDLGLSQYFIEGACSGKVDRDEFEKRYIHKQGHVIWGKVSSSLVRDSQGNPVYFISHIQNITERKLAEEALRESEQRYRLLIEQSPVAIGILQDGVLVYVNPQFLKVFGYDSMHEVLGLPVEEFYSPEDRSLITQRGKDRLSGKPLPTHYEVKGLKKNGESFDLAVWPTVVDYDGKPAILTFCADTTETKSLRSQLLQAQKMEAIGNLAGGVAHDFNNLLQVALGYSEILLVGKNPDHPDYDKLHTINATAKRGADLVQRLMVFSRKGDTKPRSLNLNHEVTQLKKLLERTIPKMIAIELSLESWLPVINADPVQVEQILLNLAVNARDAMPQEGGKLTIETRKVMLDEEYCRTHLESKPGQYVMISVSDTGHGMSQETVQHIFEPFFTTKGEGKGTGLGLAMVYGIMKHHEGFINCYSEPGHGTTFRIYFPVVPTELEEDLEQESAVPQGGSETILLVDDEESLCDIGSQLLTRAGYTVLTATNGRDAIDLYRNQRGDISLVILDLIMPEMGGKECFQELAKIDSKVKVILSSGFLSNRTSEETRVFGFRGLVEKPYNMRQLLGLVREVLDGD